MTTEQIDLQKRVKEIRERAEKAASGPWYSRPDDFTFIAHARQDIPLLLDQLALEQKRVKELEAERDHWQKRHDTVHDLCFECARQKQALEAELQQLRAERDELRRQTKEYRRCVDELAQIVFYKAGATGKAALESYAKLPKQDATPGSPAL